MHKAIARQALKDAGRLRKDIIRLRKDADKYEQERNRLRRKLKKWAAS